MSIIKGHDLMLFIDGESIAYATSHTLEVTADQTETSHKDLDYNWKTSNPQSKSWTASSENLYSLDTDHGNTAASIFLAEIEGTLVELVFAQKDTAARRKPDRDGLIGEPYEPGYPRFVGKGYINNLSLNAPDGDNATFSVQFTGSGPLEYEESSKKVERLPKKRQAG